MYDMHYDLLTILYYNLMNKKASNIEKLLDALHSIYKESNILGGIVNLYFMTPEEMKEELDISIQEMENIKEMFKQSTFFLDEMKRMGYIPQNVDFIYSIEGCDYIHSEQELEELYKLGLRSIILTWNHKNQYGSGNRTDEGLTEKGIELIKKAIDLGIIIDVSHANMQTFNDILDVYEKNKNEDSILIASHSNVRTLCNRERNLTDEQLRRLKNIGGYIGLFTNGNFLLQDNETISYEKRQESFLKHLDYIIHEIKFSTDKVLLSTDDMNFHHDVTYHNLEAYSIESIAQDIYNQILNIFGIEVAEKVTKRNAQYIINRMNKRGQT